MFVFFKRISCRFLEDSTTNAIANANANANTNANANATAVPMPMPMLNADAICEDPLEIILEIKG